MNNTIEETRSGAINSKVLVNKIELLIKDNSLINQCILDTDYVQELLIQLMVAEDLHSIYQETAIQFVENVLRGEGWTPYSSLSIEQLLYEFYSRNFFADASTDLELEENLDCFNSYIEDSASSILDSLDLHIVPPNTKTPTS